MFSLKGTCHPSKLDQEIKCYDLRNEEDYLIVVTDKKDEGVVVYVEYDEPVSKLQVNLTSTK